MKRKGNSPSWWDGVKEEGFGSLFGKLLFLILICGLFFLLALEKIEGGKEWLFSRFPILGMAGEVTPVHLYIFWLLSLWFGFQIGKLAGTKRGARKERHRLGIPF